MKPCSPGLTEVAILYFVLRGHVWTVVTCPLVTVTHETVQGLPFVYGIVREKVVIGHVLQQGLVKDLVIKRILGKRGPVEILQSLSIKRVSAGVEVWQ